MKVFFLCLKKMMDPILKKIMIEVLGTFFLVFVILTTGNFLTIGAALALAVFIGAGAYNPAVVTAQLLRKQITSVVAISMIVAELLGGCLAFFAVRYT